MVVNESSWFTVHTSETEGCRSNCIYYVRKTRYCITYPIKIWHVWGAYCVEEHKVLFERLFMEMRRCATARWFLPNVLQASKIIS
jgi:hypothetical protein